MNFKKTSLLLMVITINVSAQNIFPKKLNNCNSAKFCLDCGEVKANVDTEKFYNLIDDLNTVINSKNINGNVRFQILLDSIGNGCVLSHTDISENTITKKIIQKLNEFKGWIPAKTDGKNENKTSFNMLFSIDEGKINGKVERVDIKAFESSFDKPIKPSIDNKNFDYKNENLNKYTFTIWNSKNSNLPNNDTGDLTIDKNDIVWITARENLIQLNKESFISSEQNITEKGSYFGYFQIATDNENTKWVYGTKGIYSYNNKN